MQDFLLILKNRNMCEPSKNVHYGYSTFYFSFPGVILTCPTSHYLLKLDDTYSYMCTSTNEAVHKSAGFLSHAPTVTPTMYILFVTSSNVVLLTLIRFTIT